MSESTKGADQKKESRGRVAQGVPKKLRKKLDGQACVRVADRIYSWRLAISKERGRTLTQLELAGLCGLNVKTVAAAERATGTVHIDDYEMIAKQLGYTLAQLVAA